jgi:sensor histidine kinase YesM
MTNNREEAYSYLTMLSAMLRAILSDGSSILKSLSEEIDFISHYCEFQKLRFGERFSYSINIGEDVNLQKEVPKMTIQTFVENAVKHGFQNRKEGGIINILLTHRADYIEIIIKDNGIGRDASVKMQTEGTGYGIKTISRIFEIINQENYQKSSFQIRDLLDGESSLGTEVIIVIPDSYNFRTKGLHNDYAVN